MTDEITLVFQERDGVQGCAGFSRSGVLSGGSKINTTEEELASVFETAKSNGAVLDGAVETMDAAIDEPLSFYDYLILDADGALAFDSSHARKP